MEQKYCEVVSVRTDDISLHLKGFLQARSGPGTRSNYFVSVVPFYAFLQTVERLSRLLCL